MEENIHEDRQTIYEIGYLIATTIPEEKIPAEVDAIKKIITDGGATVIAEEAPNHISLAYTMRKKMVSGAYQKFDDAHFGWFKFELGSSKVEAIKKAVELHPSIIRMLLITTVRENTYLGKRASAVIAKIIAPVVADEKKEVQPPATVEDMDKSIDDMVKEV